MDSTITDDFVQFALRGELKSLEQQRSLLSNRISTLNKLLDDKCSEVAMYKKAMDQERLMKESAIGKLTRLKFYNHLPSSECLNLEGNDEYERRKRKLELELVEEELEWISKYQKALIEVEKKVHDKDRRLMACQDEIRNMESKIKDQDQTIALLKSNLIVGHRAVEEGSEAIDSETHLDIQLTTDGKLHWKNFLRERSMQKT